MDGFDAYSPTDRSNSGSAKQGNPDARHGHPQGSRNEQCAKEAAQCGGQFRDLTNLFDRFSRFADSGIQIDEPESVSRFFFRGRLTQSPTIGGTEKEVFLKVWKVDDVDVASVYAEWKHHNRAFKAGVPVAVPLLSELAKATCSCCGLEYLVLATEFIQIDDISTMIELWQFCSSLIQAVLTLHEQAGMLHGDVKPANLRWSKGVVSLIDFEHAQDIAKAAWAPGTDGYQAPEILEDDIPCSTKTDAFSVGRTISVMMEAFFRDHKQFASEQNQMRDNLREISLKLTDADPHRRWSLHRALQAMQLTPYQSRKTVC